MSYVIEQTILVTNFENDIIGYDYQLSLKAYEVSESEKFGSLF